MRDPVAELGIGFQKVLARRTERMDHSRFWRYLPILFAVAAVLYLTMAAASQHHRWSHVGWGAYFGIMAVSIPASKRRRRIAASKGVAAPSYATSKLRDHHAGVVLICGIAGGVVAIVWWPHHPFIAVTGVLIIGTALQAYIKITLGLARRRSDRRG